MTSQQSSRVFDEPEQRQRRHRAKSECLPLAGCYLHARRIELAQRLNHGRPRPSSRLHRTENQNCNLTDQRLIRINRRTFPGGTTFAIGWNDLDFDRCIHRWKWMSCGRALRCKNYKNPVVGIWSVAPSVRSDPKRYINQAPRFSVPIHPRTVSLSVPLAGQWRVLGATSRIPRRLSGSGETSSAPRGSHVTRRRRARRRAGLAEDLSR